MLKEKQNAMKGSIKLTAPEDLSYFLLTPIIMNFMQEYPEISVELYSSNAFLDFKEHQIDLALRIGKLEDSSLIQKKISDVRVPLIASTEYLQGHPKIKKLEDLKEHSVAFMRTIHGAPYNTEITDHINESFSSNSIPVLTRFVAQNKGLATIPTFVCLKELEKKDFQVVFDHFRSSKRALFLLTRPAKHVPSHVKVFKDYIFQELKTLIH